MDIVDNEQTEALPTQVTPPSVPTEQTTVQQPTPAEPENNSETAILPQIDHQSEKREAPKRETLYEVNGQRYAFPSDWSDEEVFALIEQDQREDSIQRQVPIQPESLVHNRDWLDASRIIWDMNNNQPFQGDDKELAEYGLDQMGWFSWNLPRMSIDTARISQATPDQKKAFLHLMNTYDDLGLSWGGLLRFGKGVLADPTTYVGLSTLGIGTAAGSATKLASKEALKSMLKAGIVTGLEGVALNVASNSMEQKVRIEGGEQTEISGKELAKAGLFGFGAGAVLGGAVDGIGTALRKAPADPLEEALQGLSRSDGPTKLEMKETPSTASPVDSTSIVSKDTPQEPLPETPMEPTSSPMKSEEQSSTLHADEVLGQHTADPVAELRDNPDTVPTLDAATQVNIETNPVLTAIREYAEDSGLRVFPGRVRS